MLIGLLTMVFAIGVGWREIRRIFFDGEDGER